MPPSNSKIPVYLEVGAKRTFAVALDWPGWSRGGKGEAAALQALLDYGPRYSAAIHSLRLGFKPPTATSALHVAERVSGDMTTDFGTPGRIPVSDTKPADEAEIRRMQHILTACWRHFDVAAEAAKGKTLSTGPRGGGRDREKIIRHVLEAEHAYLRRLGVNFQPLVLDLADAHLPRFRHAMLVGLAASAHGELPAQGPRGGRYWPARYFARREAWHVLDHAWELEDRLTGP
ncbi:MAG TPA: hypothetical protein VF784_13940 [Anaerolineales bacterium]